MHSEQLFQFKEYLKTLGRTAATVSDYASHVRPYLQGLTKDIKAVTMVVITQN